MSTFPSSIHRQAQIFFCLVLASLALAAWSPAQAATTYYVRVDGGNASQCTGKADAKYPGSGSNKACAWSSPTYALPPDDKRRIAGGDTLIIGPGDYKIGYGAPGSNVGRCGSSWRYDCYLAKIPSGPSASSKTRILGKGYNSNCPAPPSLWGTERVSLMLSLDGSSNVEVGCLEITDHSDCVEFHSDNAAKCERNSTPYGDWASVGISASASKNVWLHDLNIHGLANRGVMAGGLTDWTLDRVKIVANGWAGWDGDIGSGSSNSGQITFRHVEISWNGCGQRWQTGTIWACWAQTGSGYGDGLGTYYTGGDWVIEDSFFDHNTSDGLDLLYADGTGSVTVRRTYAAGNAGNQIKTNGNTTIENSVIVGNCAYFDGKYDMQDSDQCRALGNAVSIGVVSGKNVTIRQNTITGQGDCLIITGGGSSSSNVYIQNNALLGQLDWRSNKQGNKGELTCGHYADNSPAKVSFTGNLFWNIKQDQCPSGSICGKNPKLANMDMASFDATPLVGSPLIDKAPVLSGIVDDFYGAARPYGPKPDIGAVEWGSSAPGTPITGPRTGGNLPPRSGAGSTALTAKGLPASTAGIAAADPASIRAIASPTCQTGCTSQTARPAKLPLVASLRAGFNGMIHAIRDALGLETPADRANQDTQLARSTSAPASGLATTKHRVVEATPALAEDPAIAKRGLRISAPGVHHLQGTSGTRASEAPNGVSPIATHAISRNCLDNCVQDTMKRPSWQARIGAFLDALLAKLGFEGGNDGARAA